MKIMLADDEDAIRLALQRTIEKAGYEFCYAADGEEALEVFAAEQPDLLILDVMMPKMDGFEVCQVLRNQGVITPILFLSAKGDLVDKGIGFNLGADDYITKPFVPKELMMHIRARLQQVERFTKADTTAPQTPSTVKLDDIAHTITIKGKQTTCSPKEYALLSLLAKNPGVVFTQDEIIEQCWGKDFVGETTSVAVFVRRLREKIEDDPTHPQYLQTVWRVGYKFCC